MDIHILNAQNKYKIIQYAIESGNISKTCELFGVSRTSYYKWYNRYKEYGIDGLNNITPCKPHMPNQVDSETEKAILNYVIKCPKDGPKKIFYGLKDQGYCVGTTGIYKVLKRNNLNKREKREIYSKANKLKK